IELDALALAEVDVNLFKMAAAVVTGDAGEVDAEERFAVEDGELVVSVELLYHAEIFAIVGLRFALDMLARDDVGGSNDVIAFGSGGDDIAHSVVIRPVNAKILFHPI